MEDQDHARGEERSRRARFTTLTAIAGRGLGILISIVSVPLTIHHLDKERYGVWITVSTLLAWLAIADLGLGNGLTNALGKARAQGDERAARASTSTVFLLLTLTSIAMAIVFAAAFSFIPWARVLAVSARVDRAELGATVAIAAAVFFLAFPLNVVDKIYAACQEGYVSNYWAVATNVVSVTALIAAVRFGSGLPALVLALSGAPLLIRFANAAHLFTRAHPELTPARRSYDAVLARSLLTTGAQFSVSQLAAIAMWQNDNIIIGQLYGAEAVGPYAVAFRLAHTFITLMGMWLGPLWPAYTDAHARGDHAWIERKVWSTTRLATAATIVAAAGMIAVGGVVIRVWTRSAEMTPPRSILLPIGAYMIVYVFCMSIAMALNGLGRIRGQMMSGIIAAVINVILSIVLGRAIGVAGVCWATSIAAVIPAAAAAFELRAALREQAPGSSPAQGEVS